MVETVNKPDKSTKYEPQNTRLLVQINNERALFICSFINSIHNYNFRVMVNRSSICLFPVHFYLETPHEKNNYKKQTLIIKLLHKE